MIYLHEFPNLQGNYQTTSDPSEFYNCIAWAAGFADANWDPVDEDQYWPLPKPDNYSVAAVIAAFSSIGFSKHDLDDSHEPGIQKVAIFGTKDAYEHAARQLRNGEWTSKLGPEDDIRHSSLQALVGGSYGGIVTIIGREYPNGPALGDD